MAQDEEEIARLEARLAELKAQRVQEAHTTPAPTKKPNNLLLIGAGLFGLVILVSFCSSSDGTSESQTTTANAVGAPKGNKALAPLPPSSGDAPQGPSWRYAERKDEMTDGVTRTACVVSENTVNLDWPYGDVHAELCLRNSPRWGRDAYVALLGDGQMLCRSYDGCTVKVRFDDEAQQTFSASDSSDGSSNIVFFENRERLERGLKTADQTLVAAEFYQAGVQTMRFNTAGLSWPAQK